MVTTIKSVYGLVLISTAMIAISIAAPSTALAQEADEAMEKSDVAMEKHNGEEFVYIAKKGDNLTLLVRKSLQLYAASNSVVLDTETTIAAETCAVQTMGGFMIDVDEQVVVTQDVLADALNQKVDLSDAAKARWAVYAPIDETLSSIKPATAPDYVSEAEIATEDVAKVEETSDEPTEDASEDEKDTEVEIVREDSKDSSDDDDNAPWYWWIIGAGAVGAMWYILGGNEIIAKRRKS